MILEIHNVVHFWKEKKEEIFGTINFCKKYISFQKTRKK